MKKAFLILFTIALPFSAYCQKAEKQVAGAVAVSPEIRAAPHLPKENTEANMKAWVKSYPAEASQYSDLLMQKLQGKAVKGLENKTYDDAKVEYSTVNRLIREAAAESPAAIGK